MNMNLKTITNSYNLMPFMKATVVCTKPIPDLRSVEGKSPILPPAITDRHSIFIVGQTELTVDLLVINQGYHHVVMQGTFDLDVVCGFLEPLGILSHDVTHMTRTELTWSQVIDELDHARSYQNHSGYLKAFLDTIDGRHHVPPSQLEDRAPLRLPSRFSVALTECPHPIIELVMNDHDDGNLEDILLEIIVRHNRYYGRPMAEHVRKTINGYSSIRELAELLSSDFRRQVMHQLLILDIASGDGEFWKTFIWTQLTPFLIDLLKNTRVLVLNRNRESLELENVSVRVFAYRSGLM